MITFNNLAQRRGKIKLNRQMLYEMPLEAYQTFFSNFYPLAIENCHEMGINYDLIYYGISPLFDEIEEGTITPEYMAIFTRKYDGVSNTDKTEFTKFEKLR